LLAGESQQCAKYWPDDHAAVNLGGLRVVNMSEKVNGNVITRQFQITCGDVSKTFTQLHFTGWPDKGVVTPQQLHSLVNDVHECAVVDSPMIVHCSLGQGRTGAFILAYALTYGTSSDTPQLIVTMRN